MNEQERQNRVSSILERLYVGAKDTMGEGREDHREVLKRAYESKGQDIGANKINQMLGSNRSVSAIGDAFGFSDPVAREIRNKMGMGWSQDPVTRVGQTLGVVGSDIVQDRGRELWWLINAPQAAVNVVQEMALREYAPDLYGSDPVYVDQDTGKATTDDRLGNRPINNKKAAVGAGVAYKDGKETYTKKGYQRTKKGYSKRRNEPGFIDMLSIPSGIAINTGIGLMNPFGGQEGYKAVFPDEQDPNKTNNVVAEVAAKYILGRTGGLLNWDEFKQVRPDVSKDEYMRYKAFKFDNGMDMNPLDGDFSIPTGVLKGTTEGIHGPEVQFLGRSLPITTAILPAAVGIAGTTWGARGGTKRGLIAGLASTAAGMVGGNLLEDERRRRNAAANQRDTIN